MLLLQGGSIEFWGPATLICVLILVVALARAPWRQLVGHNQRLNLFLFSVLALALFWQLRVNAHPLLAVHPMLVVAMVLVFGRSLALCGGATAQALALLIGGGQWATLGPNSLFNLVMPVLFTGFAMQVVDRIPGKNLFFYTLGLGFFGAMLSVQVMAVSLWIYVWIFGPEPLLYAVGEYYFLTLLMMFPEGFINGALVTVLTVLKPDLVKTYDDHLYLDDR